MKNRIIGVLVLLAAFFSFTFNVNAVSFYKGQVLGMHQTADVDGKYYVSAKKWNISFEGQSDYKTLISIAGFKLNESGKNIVCIDPMYHGATRITVDHILLGEGTVNERLEYAFLKIFEAANVENGDTYADSALNSRYETATLVLRAFANIFPGWSKTVLERYTDNGAIQTPVTPSILQSFRNSMAKQGLSLNYSVNYGSSAYHHSQCVYNGSEFPCYVYGKVSEVDSLFDQYVKIGVDAYNNYNKNDVATVELSTVSGGTDAEKVLGVVIDMKNLKNGNVKYQGIENAESPVKFLGCAQSYSPRTGDYGSCSNNLASMGSRVVLGFSVAGEDEAAFDIRYSATGENLLYGAFLNNAGQDTQRYLAFSKEIDGLYHVGGGASLCDIEGIGFQLPQICGSNDYQNADGDATYSYSEGLFDGALNVKKCVLGKKDAAGNSYRLVEMEKASAVAENPYCSVYCTEGYDFTVPYSKYAESGRYFQISVKIKGTQTCYTTDFNISQYNKDIANVQNEIKAAYDKWQFYDNLVNHLNWNNGSSSYITCSYEATGYGTKTYDEVTKTYSCSKGDLPDCSYEYTAYRHTKGDPQYHVYTFNLKYGHKHSETFGDTSGGECDSPVTDYTTDYNNRKDEMQQKLAEAKDNLNRLIKKQEQIVSQYNSCATGWSLNFKFDPTVEYSYNEPNDYQNSSTKWIKEAANISCGDHNCNYMEQLSKSTSGVSSEYCASTTVGDDYSCDNTVGSNYSRIEKYFTCKANGNEYTCSSGCATVSGKGYESCSTAVSAFTVTSILHVKRTQTANALYDTPRVYYSIHPYGNIKVSTSSIKDASLVDGLPVSNGTPNGVYYYELIFGNIGTYFNTGNIGRVYSTDSTSIVQKNNGATTTPDGQDLPANGYACKYTVGGTTCVDNNGITHTKNDCGSGENWDSCKARLCPNSGSYCVKHNSDYYVCNSREFSNGGCTRYDSRQKAINASNYNYNCCPNCQIVCVGNCIYSTNFENDYEMALDYRVVSNSNIKPNDRKLGYNWNSENSSNALVARKAYKTIEEIESRANAPISEDSEETYVMKFTMTPEMSSWIKQNYNIKNITEGGYDENSTVYCEDYNLSYSDASSCENAGYVWENNKCKMTNVLCYDSFIDDLSEKFPNLVDIPNRKEPLKQYNIGTNMATNDYWTIYIYDRLDVNSDGIPDIGPSWK